MNEIIKLLKDSKNDDKLEQALISSYNAKKSLPLYLVPHRFRNKGFFYNECLRKHQYDLIPNLSSEEIKTLKKKNELEINMNDEGDDEKTIDLTNASDEEVLRVFQLMRSVDNIVVTKDDKGNTHLKDEQTGNQYMIVREGKANLMPQTDDDLPENDYENHYDDSYYEEEEPELKFLSAELQNNKIVVLKAVHKIEATERLLQVHFYQFFNTLPFNLNNFYDININGLNEKYPGFLQTFDFTNVDVYDLHKFIIIRTRLTHWYSDSNKSKSDLIYLSSPQYFICFWDKNIEDLFSIGEFEKFPLLFTDYKSSPFNDLIEVNYYDTICVFNQNGEYLNISESPNLYDDGWCKLTFLNKEYFVISLYDDNNGDDMSLYKYTNGEIESGVDIDSLELIELLDKNSIPWKINNLTNELQINKSVILKALKSADLNFSDIDDLFKKDKEIVLQAVKSFGYNLKYADSSLRSDLEVVLAAVKSYGKSLEYASDSLKSDKEVVLVAMKSSGKALEFAGVSMKSDKEIVLAAVRSEGEALKYADDLLKSDREIILAALKSYGWQLGHSNLFKYITDESLLKDRDFILEAIKLNPHILNYASDTLKSDKELVLEAVKNNGCALEFASASLQADKEVVLEAIKFDGCAIKFASTSFQDNKEVVLEAVKSNGVALSYANKRFRSEREIVLQAVKGGGFTLEVADDLLKEDKEVVLEAVKNNGRALEFASASLQADKEVVLEAIKEDTRAFEYCSEFLRNDEDFIREAFQINHKIMRFIDAKTLKKHKRLQELYKEYESRKEEPEEDLPF